MITMAIKNITGYAAAAVIVGAATTATEAAPGFAGAGSMIRDAAPAAMTPVQWGGYGYGYGYGPRYDRPYGFYRPYRPAYVAGPRCFWRPAREVFTPWGGVRIEPARRFCRY